MEIQVNPQTKKFWLAFPDGWKEGHGHEIKIGECKFSLCPTKSGILVSEVTTGAFIHQFERNAFFDFMGADKEGALDYYETFIAPNLVNLVEDNPNIGEILAKERNNIKNRLGDMPPIEDIDDSFITSPISKIKQ